jgi:hypothetical protein
MYLCVCERGLGSFVLLLPRYVHGWHYRQFVELVAVCSVTALTTSFLLPWRAELCSQVLEGRLIVSQLQPSNLGLPTLFRTLGAHSNRSSLSVSMHPICGAWWLWCMFSSYSGAGSVLLGGLWAACHVACRMVVLLLFLRQC